MSIQYALFENKLTEAANDYSARVQLRGSANLDAIVERMMSQGSTITKSDILAVLEDATKAIESLLLEGFRVNFGDLAQLYPRLKGVFNGATDGYDQARHSLDVGARPGVRIRNKIINESKVEKIEPQQSNPLILDYIDLAENSDNVNTTVTPGTIGTINGNRLKFDTAQEDEGVFFIPVDNGSEVKVTMIQKIKPKEIVFKVPDSLTSNTGYTLEVRSRSAGTNEVRTGRLDQELLVTAPVQQ